MSEKNFIGRIQTGDGFTEVPGEVREEIAKCFEALNARDSFQRPSPKGIHFLSISSNRRDWMERV